MEIKMIKAGINKRFMESSRGRALPSVKNITIGALRRVVSIPGMGIQPG
jgi:hypothetical protein